MVGASELSLEALNAPFKRFFVLLPQLSSSLLGNLLLTQTRNVPAPTQRLNQLNARRDLLFSKRDSGLLVVE